jgi:3-hydroxyisobutyrate dehydrogenase-like beta-hydroxyacid dehydrogenase
VKVAFLGLGIMGSRMAVHLVRAGHDVRVWTRTPGKAQAWAGEHGGRAAATPAAAAAGAEVDISIVVAGAQVAAVLLGGEGAAGGAPPGTLFMDMSTIAPADAVRIGTALRAAGHAFVDAPVTGSSPGAEAGTLTIMAGGDPADLERARPLLEAMGERIVRAGRLGDGQRLKLIGNAVAAANTATLAQALVVAAAAGLDLGPLAEVFANGAAASTMVALKLEPMRRHDYAPLFKTEHMLKDVRLCLEEAHAAGVPFPAAAAACEALAGAVGRGYGEQDFAAVLEVFEGLAGQRIDDP